MNPFPLIVAELRRNALGCAAVVALISFAVAISVALSAQERALKLASARAAERFELVIGAPGSPTQLVLTTVYLQPGALDLVPAPTLLALQAEPEVADVAPVAVADTYQGFPVVGTTARFATQGGTDPLIDGRAFARIDEAMIGAAVDLIVGAKIRLADGATSETGIEAPDHDTELTVVGKLTRSGTPWDRAILVPIEAVWKMHAGSPDGAVGTSGSFEPTHIGAPWMAGDARPVPALVVRARTLADANRLRQEYRNRDTLAVFPAEVLDPVFAILGNLHELLRSVTFAFNGLLVTAVLLVMIAAVSARRRSIGVLRALGASPAFVFVAVWLQGALLIAAGVLAGVALGFALAKWIAALASAELGVAIDATLGAQELALAAAVLVAGSLLAAAPSLPTLRVPVSRLLRRA